MASVEESLKLKRGHVDPWSTREKLCLASIVERSGNQNLMSVSRSLKVFGGEPGRPADWFSQKSCAVQYDNLLTRFETPKRKKRGADGSKAEGVDLTPAELIVKHLTVERIEELRKQMAEARTLYMRDKEDLDLVQNGQADDRLEEIILQIEEEKRLKEAKQEEQQQWLRQREERKQEMSMAWRPQAHLRGPVSQTARRSSNQSELGSETDNVESPASSDQPVASEEAVESKPASTPTSPLLTSLLKSPSPVTGSQSSSILHSAITSQRGASPTITSLLNSSPSVPSSGTSIPLSPNLKSLVSNALAGHDEVPKPQSHSASSSPTLSMLLELPPSTPGKLPELPYSATKQPASTATSKPGDQKEKATVEPLLDEEGTKPSQQSQSAVHPRLEIEGPKFPEPQLEFEDRNSSSLGHSSAETVLEVECPESPERSIPATTSALEVEGSEFPKQKQTNLEIADLISPDQCEPTSERQFEVQGSHLEPYQPAVESPLKVEAAQPVEECQTIIQVQNLVEESTSVDQLHPPTEPRIPVEGLKLPVYHLAGMKPSEQCHTAVKPAEAVPKSPEKDSAAVEPLPEVVGQNSPQKGHAAVKPQPEVEVPKPLENCQPHVALEVASSCVSVQNYHETSQSSNEVTSNETSQQGVPITEPSQPQHKEPSDRNVVTAMSEANAGDVVDALKKEPAPDNMEIVLPMETEAEVPETEGKVNLDSTDLQQLTSEELEEYVVDPSSIGVVLQELVPGLVDGDGVCLLNVEEADDTNMLEAAETDDGTASNEVVSEIESNLNKASGEVPSQEQEQVKDENETVSVVHTALAQPSPQRTVTTPQSAAVSPRVAGRPAKGSMVARKIVMEVDDAAKSEVLHSEETIQQLEGDSETLSREDLENASIVFMQDGVLVQDGVVVQDSLVMKLNESEHSTSIVNDIHVIQDSSSNSVVIVPHEDVIAEKEMNTDQDQTKELPLDDNVERGVIEKDIHSSSKLEINSPIQTLQKSSEKYDAPREPNPAKKVDDSESSLRTPIVEGTDLLPVSEIEEPEPSQPQEENLAVATNIPEETSDSTEELQEEEIIKKSDTVPSSEKLKKQKPSSPTKRDKSPVNESSNEVASEEDVVKAEAKEEDKAKRDTDQKIQEKKTDETKESIPSQMQMEDEDTRHPDTETQVVQIKEEKHRADTPSTEDDNTRDTEQAAPVKRGRGRYARESTANSDSVPNSPVPTYVSIEEHKAWKKSIMLVYNRIAQHKNASIFLRPITDDIAPGYSSMVARPLDLQTIKKNIETGLIRTIDEFQRDILLMFNNAIMYNKSNTPIHDMAREMQEEGVAHLNEYKNTQLVLQTVGAEGGHLPSRRGTRTAEKRDQDSDGFSTRRAGSVTGLLGKRKRSLPDDKLTPKRRRDDD